MFWSNGPLLYLELMLRDHLGRARNAPDRGASAIEWVIISAILVVIAGAVGGVLYAKINDKARGINLDTPVGGP